MTQNNKLLTPPIQPAKVSYRMAAGAVIGLILIALYLSGVKHPNPKWGEYWMIRPFIVVPFAGAMGGLCNYFILHYHKQFGVSRTIAVIISVIVAVIGLWLGIVLGLDGTLWD